MNWRQKWLAPDICNDKSSVLCVEPWKFRQKRGEKGRMQCSGLITTLTHSRQTVSSGIAFARLFLSFHLINQFLSQ